MRARKPTAFNNGLTAIQALRKRDYEWLRKYTHRGPWGRPARIDTWPRDRCISWAMVLAARHARTDQWSRNQRQEFHAKLDKEGFITIQNFLKLKMCRCLKVTPQDVERVLRYDEENGSRDGKRRFGTRWLGHRLEAFAAEQGHTTRACDQIDMDRFALGSICQGRRAMPKSRVPGWARQKAQFQDCINKSSKLITKSNTQQTQNQHKTAKPAETRRATSTKPAQNSETGRDQEREQHKTSTKQ